MIDSENIKKYIYYLTDNPLSELNVTANLIETGHIVLTPFDSTILSQERITLFLNPYEGNFRSSSISDLMFLVDIIIPNGKWLLNGLGQIRGFRIADEISQLIDQQKVAGLTEPEITRFKIYKVNEDYSGLTLWIKINSSSMKGLR
jgi:hypothetical protein